MLCDTGQCPAFGSREHAHHLDALVEHALEDGADALLTLDLDSFPISDTWLETISRVAPKQSGIAGILRAENGDTVLPHPSCLLVPAEFASRHRFSFSPDTDGSKEFRRFLRTRKQAADTGIRLAQILDQHDLPWGKLLRTNVRDLHPLIAGIYVDSVFHLGAGSRAGLFRRDLQTSTVYRITRPLERLPVSGAARRASNRLVARLRRGAEQRLIAANALAADQARTWLRQDPDGLFAYLRGVDSSPPGPSSGQTGDHAGSEAG